MSTLEYLRRQRGFTVAHVHRQTGLAETTIYRAESASSVLNVSAPTLKKFMDFYDVSLGYLLSLERDTEERRAA